LSSIINTGQILDLVTNQKVEYALLHGLDFDLSNDADNTWKSFNLRILKQLEQIAAGINQDFYNLCKTFSLEDAHWSWVSKAFHCIGAQYEWFYLVTNGTVQGICVVFHPKASRLDSDTIFYIDYLATAPWNRINPLSELRYKGIGTILLKESLIYSIKSLHYRPGFSLHSLPKAVTYYEKIGMHNYGPDPTKGNMPYFEMDQKNSEVFIDG